jgi:formyltetrahydrofolate-dependent phosphoribosylglycinamide formyltransferase
MNRLAVLISGNGSNLQAIIDHIAAGDLDAEISVVVSNRADAYGLQRAAAAGIPTEVLDLVEIKAAGGDRIGYDVELAGLVAGYEPDVVVLAGWMLILGNDFLQRFTPHIINLHPALPGAFPGTDAIARAYAAYQAGDIKHTGVMVHRVVEEVDAGTVIVKEPVPIFPDDSLADLEERIHLVEHNLIVAAIDMVLRAL